MTTHSPLPWRLYGKASKTSNFGNWRARICTDPNHAIATVGYCLGGDKDEPELAEANAALIVRAVNAHEALVQALRRCASYVRTAMEGEGEDHPCMDYVREAEAALKLATH